MADQSRRRFLASVGSATVVGTAGCLGFLRTDLDLRVINGLDEPIDYDLVAGEFETSGSLVASGRDEYEAAVEHPGGDGRVELSVRFGLRAGSAFMQRDAGTDILPIDPETDAVFVLLDRDGVRCGTVADRE